MAVSIILHPPGLRKLLLVSFINLARLTMLGMVIVGACLLVVMSLLVDIVYSVLYPRVRLA